MDIDIKIQNKGMKTIQDERKLIHKLTVLVKGDV